MNAYYKDRSLNNIILAIMTQMMNNPTIQDSSNLLVYQLHFRDMTPEINKIMSDLFMMMTGTDQDPFYISAKLIKKAHIEYLTYEQDPKFLEQKSELLELRLNMINFIEDYICGKFYEDLEKCNPLMDPLEIKNIADKDAKNSISYLVN